MKSVELQNLAVERGDGGQVTLQIAVAPQSVQAAREEVIRSYSKQLRVPGFRPGRVPVNIVRRSVGDEAIAQRVSDELVPLAYQQALEQAELQPLERAQVDDLTFDAFNGDEPLQFTARVIVRPTIELGELTGLQLEAPSIETTDEDVEQGLEALRNERATLKNIEGRSAQEGDVLSAELRVFIDGEEKGEGEGDEKEPTRLRQFVLGESGFAPSIDEHLIGAQLDEERTFNVTYPSEFNDPELAGQAAEFHVKVTSLKERILPELDDAFAQVAGAENLDELRERMRTFILDGRGREAREAVRAEAARLAAEGASFETPTSLVESRFERRLHDMEHELEHRNTTLEEYLTHTGRDRDEFDAEARGEIERELRQELVLDEIARRENLSVSTEEIESYYVNMATATRQPIEQLVQQVEVQSVRATILRRKAVDWLVQNAEIAGLEDEDEAAAEPEAEEESLIVTPGATAPAEGEAPQIIVPGQ